MQEEKNIQESNPENISEKEIQTEFQNTDKENSLENELAELRIKNVELADQYLRAKAEAENIRRRSSDEITKARKFSIETFAESLLPVCDSLEAALNQKDVDSKQIIEGIEATLQQLKQVLERNKVLTIEPVIGDKFNPTIHQAISTIDSEQEKDTIVNLLQKGYLIAERVLRPALVVVAN